MHDERVRLHGLDIAGVEGKAALDGSVHCLPLVSVAVAFALHARLIEEVTFPEREVEILSFHEWDAGRPQLLADVLAEPDFKRADEPQFEGGHAAVLDDEPAERADRPAMIEVAAEREGEAIAFSQPEDGVQVEQGLRGVLARAVAGVDDRNRRDGRDASRRADLLVAHHERVDLIAREY